MSALIMFRTLLFAQRGERALSEGGVPSDVVKAPRTTEDNGCAYGVRLSERYLDRALRILRERELAHGKVLLPDGKGGYREAAR